MVYVGSGRTRLHLRPLGSGLPLVVVHGGPDFDHEYFRPELDALAEQFRLVYYDQRGRGRSFSGQGPDPVTIATETEDLDRVRDWTGQASVALLGHSWGGLLALEYAIRYPDRVSRLILMNTAPASRAAWLVFRRALAARRSPEQIARMSALVSDTAYQAGDIGLDAEYYRIHFAAGVRRPEHLDKVVRRLRTGFTAEAIVAARRIEDGLYAQTSSRDDYDLTPQLRRMRVPALVIHGSDDFVPLEIARGIAGAIPGSRLIVVPECGHFAYLEQPDRVRSAITEFLGGRP